MKHASRMTSPYIKNPLFFFLLVSTLCKTTGNLIITEVVTVLTVMVIFCEPASRAHSGPRGLSTGGLEKTYSS